MLKLDITNSRHVNDNDDFFNLAGRGDYCKSLGLKMFTKEYRACKDKLKADDKAREEARRAGGTASTSSNDWVASDNVVDTGNTKGSTDNSGQPSSDAKNNNPTSDKILGMEKPIAIPVIALSLLALGIGGFFLIKKLSK